jgi:hypothetical protein
MKKASLILVALLLLVGVSLSAEAKWTNWGEGIMYPLYKVGDADATAGWGPGWNGTGADQEWEFDYDGDNVGFYARFGFGGKDIDVLPLLRYAVYFQPFDMLKVTMGAPRISDYRAATFIAGAHTGRVIDGDYGAVVQLMPVEGLSAGAVVYIPSVDPAVGTVDWGQAFGFGASYALPNIATVYGSARLDNEWFNVSVDVTALQGIGLMASFAYDWTAGEEGMYVLASAKAGVGPVNVALDAGLKNNVGTAFDTMAFAADVDAQYGLNDMWTVGAMVGYDNGVGLVGSGENTPGVGFSLFPYVKAGFGDSYLKLGFVYASGYDARDSLAQADAIIAIPIMYVISF